MPRAPDLLRRFLPAGAPGAAAVAGVPTDRLADVTAELAPVFARLAAIEARCDEVVAQGRADAADLTQGVPDQVRAVVVAAEQRAARERADALARAQQVAQEQTEAELADALAQAAQLRADAAARIPELVAQVTAAVAALVGAAGPEDPT